MVPERVQGGAKILESSFFKTRSFIACAQPGLENTTTILPSEPTPPGRRGCPPLSTRPVPAGRRADGRNGTGSDPFGTRGDGARATSPNASEGWNKDSSRVTRTARPRVGVYTSEKSPSGVAGGSGGLVGTRGGDPRLRKGCPRPSSSNHPSSSQRQVLTGRRI